MGGHAMIEAVLALPLLLLLILGIMQLTLVAQARLMTHYAAYQAARAGIVWSGSRARMLDAARFALLPTLARTDSLERIVAAFERRPPELELELEVLEAGEGDFDDAAPEPLKIELRYRYELRVPFAAQLLFHCAPEVATRDGQGRYYLKLAVRHSMHLQSTFNPKWRATR